MASESFSEVGELQADLESCYQLLTDEAFVQKKFARNATKSIDINFQRDDNGHCQFQVERRFDTKGRSVPAFARKLVKDEVVVTIKQSWKKVSENSYAADVEYLLDSLPVSVTGQIILTSIDEQLTSQATHINCQVNIPLIGGKAAKLLAEAARKRVVLELSQNQDELRAQQ